MRKALLSAVCAAALSASGHGLAQTPPANPPPAVPAPAAPAPDARAPAPSGDADASRAEQDRDREAAFIENQVADRIDARIAQAKADLRLTAEQDANWAGFATAARAAALADARRRYEWDQRMGRQRGSTMRDERRGMRDDRMRGGMGDDRMRGNMRDERMRDGMREDRMRDDRMRAERPDPLVMIRAQADDMAARAADMRKLTDAMEPLYRSLEERQQARLLRFVDRFIR